MSYLEIPQVSDTLHIMYDNLYYLPPVSLKQIMAWFLTICLEIFLAQKSINWLDVLIFKWL